MENLDELAEEFSACSVSICIHRLSTTVSPTTSAVLNLLRGNDVKQRECEMLHYVFAINQKTEHL